MSGSHTTTDHEKIKKWAEDRGGVPATVKETESLFAKCTDQRSITKGRFPTTSPKLSINSASKNAKAAKERGYGWTASKVSWGWSNRSRPAASLECNS
jgi:hypothetical protein